MILILFSILTAMSLLSSATSHSNNYNNLNNNTFEHYQIVHVLVLLLGSSYSCCCHTVGCWHITKQFIWGTKNREYCRSHRELILCSTFNVLIRKKSRKCMSGVMPVSHTYLCCICVHLCFCFVLIFYSMWT